MKDKKLKILIRVLAVLFAVSLTALVGILLVRHFTHSEPAIVEVPGNIITSDDEDSPDKEEKPVSETMKSETTEGTSHSKTTKTDAITLHNKQPEDNTPFQATNLFPGDKVTKYYCVKVFYKDDIILRYHADIRSGYEKLSEVLKVKIRLIDEDKTLYDGFMRDMPASLEYALSTDASTQSELHYGVTAYLDTSVGNKYMDKSLIADFRWWVEETDHLDAPQTGDNVSESLWIGIAVGSLCLLLFLLKRNKKEAANETGK